MQPVFFHDLKRSMRLLEDALHLNENDDIVVRTFETMGQKGVLYYVDGMVGSNLVADFVLRPLLRCQQLLRGRDAVEHMTLRLIEAAAVDVFADGLPGGAAEQLGQIVIIHCIVAHILPVAQVNAQLL